MGEGGANILKIPSHAFTVHSTQMYIGSTLMSKRTLGTTLDNVRKIINICIEAEAVNLKLFIMKKWQHKVKNLSWNSIRLESEEKTNMPTC